MKKKLTPSIIIQIILFLVLIAVDQWTKYLAVIHLKGQGTVPLIPGALEFKYLENHGAAFSMFQNRQWLFYIITAIVLIIVFGLWGRVVLSLKRYALLGEEFKPKTFKNGLFLNYILMILAAGAIGNLIDRIRLHYVVDFIYISLINFPIFNFADICVSVSAVLLVVFFIFIYKEDKNFAIFSDKKS
ncbi:MAG: signal peptidase II [Lachnospiraceae bacterium]|nr:signal peptidase II [Lachnospiraceae bacterium]